MNRPCPLENPRWDFPGMLCAVRRRLGMPGLPNWPPSRNGSAIAWCHRIGPKIRRWPTGCAASACDTATTCERIRSALSGWMRSISSGPEAGKRWAKVGGTSARPSLANFTKTLKCHRNITKSIANRSSTPMRTTWKAADFWLPTSDFYFSFLLSEFQNLPFQPRMDPDGHRFLFPRITTAWPRGAALRGFMPLSQFLFFPLFSVFQDFSVSAFCNSCLCQISRANYPPCRTGQN